MTDNTACILIVEDDEIVLDIIATALASAGWSCVTAQSGEDALRILQDGAAISLVLLDIHLPAMSGLDLAAWLQQRTTIPFIMLTALDDEASVAAAVAHGALSYLVKPIDVEKLLPQVRVSLARHGDLHKLRKAVRSLDEALHADRSVSVAIGMLMQSDALSEDEAFRVLRARARTARLPILTLARQIIAPDAR